MKYVMVHEGFACFHFCHIFVSVKVNVDFISRVTEDY